MFPNIKATFSTEGRVRSSEGRSDYIIPYYNRMSRVNLTARNLAPTEILNPFKKTESSLQTRDILGKMGKRQLKPEFTLSASEVPVWLSGRASHWPARRNCRDGSVVERVIGND